MNTDEHRFSKKGNQPVRFLRRPVIISAFICVNLLLFLLLSCSSKTTDPRSLIPADSLVYLETSDLGKALDAITSNPKFLELAKNKPDLSALNGIRLSIAVTGFQTSEEAVSEENAVLNFKPRFVAVAETNAWNYQALSFAENKLGEFVNEIYGGEVLLETVDKHGGKYFTWTANDGRKAFALVRGSLIFFGNDQTAIDNCVNVMNGGAESIAKKERISAFAADALAAGYISKDGVAQLSSIVGLQFANKVGEDAEVRSVVAGIFTPLLRSSINEVSWTARKNDTGIEDSLVISLSSDIAEVFAKTLISDPNANHVDGRDSVISSLISELPSNVHAVTRYNFSDPQIAWRSVLLAAQRKGDETSSMMIGEFAKLLFEPYGIRDPEMFLSSVGDARMGRNILSARLDPESEETIVIATRGERESSVLKALISPLKPIRPIIEGGINTWSSEDENLQVVFAREGFGIGERHAIEACLFRKQHAPYEFTSEAMRWLAKSDAPVASVAVDQDSVARIASVLSGAKNEDGNLELRYATETRFNQNGIERRTVSDFGLIGTIIEQLGRD